MSLNLESLKEFLEENLFEINEKEGLGEEIAFINYGNSFGFKSDLFLLEFNIDDEIFLIKNFEIPENLRSHGYGQEIINLLIDYIGHKLRIELEDILITEEAENLWSSVGLY